MVYIKQVLNLSILRKGNIKCNTLLILNLILPVPKSQEMSLKMSTLFR